MAGRVVYHALDPEKNRYFVDDVEVTREEWDRRYPSKKIGVTGASNQGACWPQKSLAFGVHPKLIKKAMQRNARHGVNVTYDAKGHAIIPDRGTRAKLCRLEGMHDNDGGFNDYTGFSGNAPNGIIVE